MERVDLSASDQNIRDKMADVMAILTAEIDFKAKAQKEYWDEEAKRLNDLNDRKYSEQKKVLAYEAKAQRELDNLKAKKDLELSKARTKAQKKEIEQKYALEQKELDKQHEKRKKQIEKLQDAENRAKHRAAAAAAGREAFDLKNGKTLSQRIEALKTTTADGKDVIDPNKIVAGLADMAKQLESAIDKIGNKKGAIDTRLQGSGNFRKFGSYWDQFSSDMVGIAGISPFIKQSKLSDNLSSMVEQGIAFDVEQRAFLQTISEKIATTFDANDSALRRLIRIQQEDTTAGRLGMESAMTAFLNHMYENTEYLKGVASSVRQSIQEASALMTGTQAAAFEYQVQKWMGSLYSVGMDQGTVNGISQALGQLAAGDISGLTGSGAGNLMVMAANKAGISIADILNNGLTDAGTNALMKAMVAYMSDSYNQTANSKVVRQQLAGVFGLKGSDLRAAANLSKDLNKISGNNMNYNNMMLRLNLMAGTMGMRTGMGEMLSNVWDNAQYSIASGIASNPALYAMYKAAGLLDTFGGIAIPAFSVMGNMIDLETNVADLMRVGALGGGAMSAIGQMLTGLGGGVSTNASLLRLGIFGGPKRLHRGFGGIGMIGTSGGLSESGYIGNSDSSAVKDKTMQDANDDADKVMAEKQEENEDLKIRDLNDTAVKIVEMLDRVVSGTNELHIKLNENDLSRIGGFVG